jgi:2-phospho-L-lactate guanylyltransferase
MSLWVIIPVKPLSRAKSRLSTVLSPEQRQHLAEQLMRHVLSVVKTVPQVNGTLVISRDNKALAIAREYGAHTVQESGAPELNNALMRATQVVRGWKGGAVLILPADLPLLERDDVVQLVEQGRRNCSVVIATDRNGDGTNAMLVRPPGLISYTYGVGSFDRHVAAAREVGATVNVVHSPRLSLDIDLPDDLEQYYRLNGDSQPLYLANPDNV